MRLDPAGDLEAKVKIHHSITPLKGAEDGVLTCSLINPLLKLDWKSGRGVVNINSQVFQINLGVSARESLRKCKYREVKVSLCALTRKSKGTK